MSGTEVAREGYAHPPLLRLGRPAADGGLYMYTVDRENTLRAAIRDASDEDLRALDYALQTARGTGDDGARDLRIRSLADEVRLTIEERDEPEDEESWTPLVEDGAFKEALVRERLRDEYGESDV